MPPISIKFAKVSQSAIIPMFAHNGDSGFDLHITESVTLLPNERKALKTGLLCELPHNYEIQIRPRSGVSTSTKLVIIFATIDSCYRGEIHIIAHNTDTAPIFIEKGRSIAQGVINRLPVINIQEIELDELSETSRGSNGFGSTTKADPCPIKEFPDQNHPSLHLNRRPFAPYRAHTEGNPVNPHKHRLYQQSVGEGRNSHDFNRNRL